MALYFLFITFITRTKEVDKVGVRDSNRTVLIFISNRRVYAPARAYFVTGCSNERQVRMCTMHCVPHAKRDIGNSLLFRR